MSYSTRTTEAINPVLVQVHDILDVPKCNAPRGVYKVIALDGYVATLYDLESWERPVPKYRVDLEQFDEVRLVVKRGETNIRPFAHTVRVRDQGQGVQTCTPSN